MTAARPASGELAPATFLQRGLWPRLRHAAPGAAFAVRAARFTGRVQLDRLHAAIREVHAGLPALDVSLVEGPDGRLGLGRHGALDLRQHDLRPAGAGERDAACLALLRRDLERPVPAGEALTRFHTVRLADDEVVLGLVSHELVLDERSLYLVLGAVLQAYQGSFRPSRYRDFTQLTDFYPVGPAAAVSRRAWWSAWLTGCPLPGERPAARQAQTTRIGISGPDWRALADSGGTMRDNGSLGVAALAAWAVAGITGRPERPSALATVLDLRDYCDLGPVVGPLTDRVPFRVELPAGPGPSFRQLFRKTQVGVLRSTTHYLPYGELVEVGTGLGAIAAPRTAALWDVSAHLCANPPGSGRDRGPEHGISVELFREAELLSTAAAADPRDWDGTNAEIRMGERAGGMEVVIDVNPLHRGYAAGRLADRIGAAVTAAVADPEAPLVVT